MLRTGLLVAALLSLAACGTVPPQSSPLADSAWRVSSVNGRPTPPGPAAYSMTFERERLAARFGCNHIGGNYRISGSTLTTDALVMTEMACGEPAASFEAQGTAILMQPMTTDRNGPRMTLSNPVGTIELVRSD